MGTSRLILSPSPQSGSNTLFPVTGNGGVPKTRVGKPFLLVHETCSCGESHWTGASFFFPIKKKSNKKQNDCLLLLKSLLCDPCAASFLVSLNVMPRPQQRAKNPPFFTENTLFCEEKKCVS